MFLNIKEGKIAPIIDPAYLQVLVQVVPHDEVMGHAHSVRLHWMCGPIIKVTQLSIIEVGHLEKGHHTCCIITG